MIHLLNIHLHKHGLQLSAIVDTDSDNIQFIWDEDSLEYTQFKRVENSEKFCLPLGTFTPVDSEKPEKLYLDDKGNKTKYEEYTVCPLFKKVYESLGYNFDVYFLDEDMSIPYSICSHLSKNRAE